MRGGMGRDEPDLVTASEVASYDYCAEQCWLEHGLGLELGNGAAMDAGTRHHERKAAEHVAGGGRSRWGVFWPFWRPWCSSSGRDDSRW
jgi:hypothetical protein